MSKKYIEIASSFECVVEDPGDSGWFGESGEKKTPYIRIPVRVSEGPYSGQIAVWNGWLSDAAFDNTIRRLREVFGFDGDLNALYEKRQTLAGLPCNITTEIETYNGKQRCKIAWLNEPGGGGGGGAKPMEADKLSGLLSRLGTRSKAIAKATPTKVSSRSAAKSVTSNTVTQEVNDDDVPF